MSDEGRIKLAHLPTPLERLASLSSSLGGPEIWVKRDDCTGLASGGNKARKLEHLMHDALAKGADTIITAGGISQITPGRPPRRRPGSTCGASWF